MKKLLLLAFLVGCTDVAGPGLPRPLYLEEDGGSDGYNTPGCPGDHSFVTGYRVHYVTNCGQDTTVVDFLPPPPW